MTKTPRYQPFHDLPAAQYQGLLDDIAKRGIVEPIVVDENDVTIDGHQRRRIAAELHLDCPRRVVDGLSEDEKQSLAIALNLYRRHLVGVERSKALQSLANLGMSVRRIAEATGQARSTVQRDLAASPSQDATSGVPDGTPEPPPNVDKETGEVYPPDRAAPKKVIGKDGKSYAAKKPVADGVQDGIDALAAKVAASDVGYRSAVSKAIHKAGDLLLLEAERTARVHPLEDRAALRSSVQSIADKCGEILAVLDETTKLRRAK